MNKKQKGFTLIELMIVVAIIGILAAIAIPKFAEMLEKSRDGATKGNIGAVKSAIAIYYGDHEGVNPSDLTEAWLGGTSQGWGFRVKYMDDLPPVKSLGQNPMNAANKGAGPGAGGAASSKNVMLAYNASGGLSAAPSLVAAAAAVGYGYRYESSSGLIWVNSSLLDMNTKPYTLYGYE